MGWHKKCPSFTYCVIFRNSFVITRFVFPVSGAFRIIWCVTFYLAVNTVLTITYFMFHASATFFVCPNLWQFIHLIGLGIYSSTETLSIIIRSKLIIAASVAIIWSFSFLVIFRTSKTFWFLELPRGLFEKYLSIIFLEKIRPCIIFTVLCR